MACISQAPYIMVWSHFLTGNVKKKKEIMLNIKNILRTGDTAADCQAPTPCFHHWCEISVSSYCSVKEFQSFKPSKHCLALCLKCTAYISFTFHFLINFYVHLLQVNFSGGCDGYEIQLTVEVLTSVYAEDGGCFDGVRHWS